MKTHASFFTSRVSSDGSLSDALAVLVAAVVHAKKRGEFCITRFETRINRLDLLKWLATQTHSLKLYWSARDEVNEVAGIGITHEAAGDNLHDPAFFRLITSMNESAADIRYLGCAHFDAQAMKEPLWQGFHGFRFVLPQIEISNRHGEFLLACHVAAENAPSWEFAKQNLIDALTRGQAASSEATFEMSETTKTLCSHDLNSWTNDVDSVLQAISATELEKVVLAQRQMLVASKPINALALLVGLKRRVPEAYHFYFQFESHKAFFGASPERLFARDQMRIHTEAQAGTRTRGKDEAEDLKFEKELLSSDKDQLEHELVLREIQHVLSELCVDHGVRDNRQVIKLPNVQHLRSQMSGILKPGVSDAQILNALHPTPAVCGLPKSAALTKIRELEPFDRGCYAGPVGYLSGARTEFAVGIRSALVDGDRLYAYAGAGIVKGSKAIDEWQEVENKMSLLTNGF